MTKKDILELKRRLTKEGCTFTRLTGCYINSEKQQIVKINESFLNLEDEEFFKYLEIARKVMSGTVDNNLLELDFPSEEEEAGGHQQFLMGMREDKLKNEELLERFYELIINSYDYTGNYLILLFHDTYDIMTRTSDKLKLDESEEVYEYLICAICPVELSKAGLGYRKEENRIGVRVRDWVVKDPENGFIFPAFSDRSADIHSAIYYCKNAKDPRPSFMETGLGCIPKRTAAEQKEIFTQIVKKAVGEDEDKAKDLMLNVQENLHDIVAENEENSGEEVQPVILTPETITEVMSDAQVPTEIAGKIKQAYEEAFTQMPPAADHLIDNKALAALAQKKKEIELEKEVLKLRKQMSADGCDVELKVKPDKASQISARVIDGVRCLVIPMEEEEKARVNGELLEVEAQ